MTDGELVARLRSGRPVHVRVLGGSMWPTIRAGALLLIQPTQKVARGDLVAYQNQDGKLIVHRLVHRRGDRLWLKGDGLFHVDPPIPIAAVVGAAVVVEQPPLRVRLPRASEWWLLARHALFTLRRRLHRMLALITP